MGTTLLRNKASKAMVQPENIGHFSCRNSDRLQPLRLNGPEITFPSMSIKTELHTTQLSGFFSMTSTILSTLPGNHTSSWSLRNM